jgi:hypothetical protein
MSLYDVASLSNVPSLSTAVLNAAINFLFISYCRLNMPAIIIAKSNTLFNCTFGFTFPNVKSEWLA